MQRYDTVGDYQEVDDGRAVAFRISAMPDWRSEAAVADHELVEYFLVKRSRINLQAIDDGDLDHTDAEEPGDVADCPYGLQHRFAENIERLLVAQLGMTWAEHSENVDGAATVGFRSGRSTRPHRRTRPAGEGVAGRSGGGLRDGAGAAAAVPSGAGLLDGPTPEAHGRGPPP